jgi:hypothetical protein
MVVDHHERLDAPEYGTRVPVAKQPHVRLGKTIVRGARIVEPGGCVDVHLIASEDRKPGRRRLRIELLSQPAIRSRRDRQVEKSGRILARAEDETRAHPGAGRLIFDQAVAPEFDAEFE